MSGENTKKRFSLGDLGKSASMSELNTRKATIRDQDNVQPTIPPPRIFQLDNPRLAPRGSKGISTSLRTPQSVDINVNVNVRLEPPKPPPPRKEQNNKARVQLGDHDRTKREFKPIAGNSYEKGWSR